MPESSPTIVNASNFRDLADHVHSVPLRRRVLYRSDHLGALDDRDAQQVQALGIRRVLDFRGVNERVSNACAVPGVEVHSLAIEPTIVQVLTDLAAAGHQLTGAEIVGHMQETYRNFVRHNTHRFAAFFGYLLESDDPTVFHCTAGKDRTGFAAALVLQALDASPEDVMQDYLLTNERLRAPASIGWGLSEEAVSVLWGVQPAFLQAAFDTVDTEFGGLDAYLRDGLGLREAERARLRSLYLRRD